MGAVGFYVLNRLGVPPPRSSAQPRLAWLVAGALGLAAVALGTVVWCRTRSRRRRRRRMQQVGTVAQLWIYPVKSCRGVAVREAECTAFGLRQGHLRDRFWLVIDETGNMVTARQEPRLVEVSMTGPLRRRQPLLALSEASLADLNRRLRREVQAATFRPDVVISGCAVYAEDSWDALCIGDVELRRVMACSRCVLTTVDPDTGVMSRKEPLETLRSYACVTRLNKNCMEITSLRTVLCSRKARDNESGRPLYLLGQS